MMGVKCSEGGKATAAPDEGLGRTEPALVVQLPARLWHALLTLMQLPLREDPGVLRDLPPSFRESAKPFRRPRGRVQLLRGERVAGGR